MQYIRVSVTQEGAAARVTWENESFELHLREHHDSLHVVERPIARLDRIGHRDLSRLGRRRIPEERTQLAGPRNRGVIHTEWDLEVQNGNFG